MDWYTLMDSDIIRMAREAGNGDVWWYGDKALERFANLVAAAERSRAERAEALLREAQTEIDGEDDWIEWVAKVGDHLREVARDSK